MISNLKLPAILLSLILIISCEKNKSIEDAGVHYGGTARIELQSANDNLFPFLIQESNLRQVSEYLLNPTLIQYKDDGQPEGLLVSAWQAGTGNTSITYVLNSAFRWSNGAPVSTTDIAFTFVVMQLPYFKKSLAERYKVIRDVEIIDSLSFKISFSRPVADMYYHSNIPVLPAVFEKFISEPPALLQAYQNEFVGCGPFLLEQTTQDSLVLRKNEHYPGEFPRLEQLVIYFYRSEDQLAQQIRNSQVDLVVDLPFSLVNLINEKSGYKILTYPEHGYSFVAWNLKKDLFKDISIRQALSLAIDRDALVNGILAGYARKIEGPVYPGLKEINNALPALVYDPQKAEQLLDETGWRLDESTGVRKRKGERFSFTLMINRENLIRKEIALNIKANLAAVGIKIDIEITDWHEIRQVIQNKNFDALLLTWVDEDVYDPSQIFHSTGIDYGLNMMSYQNSRIDSLIELGLNALDPDLRSQAWADFQYTVASDLPCTFLYGQEIICGISASLQDVSISERGYLINVKEWWTSNR